MIFSVDRIEGNLAVLIGDDGRKISLNLSELSFKVKEGDILIRSNDKWTIDPDESERRRAEAYTLLESLFE